MTDPGLVGLLSAGALVVLYGLGVLSGLDAVMRARTPQGATAWVLALFLMPLVAVPLYWIFGRTKFDDYIETMQEFDRRVEEGVEEVYRRAELDELLVDLSAEEDERDRGELRAFKELATQPLTHGNGGWLLVDGEETFEAIFAGIDAAERYLLAQFYILHDDEIGALFKARLIAAARRGVRVYLLYDAIGSYALPRSYLDELGEAGVETAVFGSRRGWLARFRLNFRNHRKIVVVDGVRAYMGGLNVGDEYLGRDEELSPWRDTHLEVEGPIVQGLQLSFVRDWFYSCGATLDLSWRLHRSDRQDRRALVLASGPADELETCGLLFTHAIESAEDRVWIATPYFVPDGRVLGALQLASLRGVDVRVIMPRQTDSVLFRYVPYAFLAEVERAGVEVYLYEEGFMHQKAILVDDDYGAVGTANLDNRSFRLNFEVTCMFHDEGFCAELRSMLERDLARSTRLTQEDLAERSFLFRLASQATRLLAPVL